MNGYFNNSSKAKPVMAKGGGQSNPRGGSSMSIKEKPGFSTGVPGKTQSKDRSGGVKKLKTHADSEGL